jgi:hypothetical protein
LLLLLLVVAGVLRNGFGDEVVLAPKRAISVVPAQKLLLTRDSEALQSTAAPTRRNSFTDSCARAEGHYRPRMEPMTLDALIKVLQASISPIAMVSGVGLLLLSLTNRFARVTDRIRELARHRGKEANSAVERQITIFHQRARIIRNAVSAAVGCMLLASLMVLLLFAMAIWYVPAQLIVLLLFGASLLSLVTTLLLFLWDMRLSLSAVEEELKNGAA